MAAEFRGPWPHPEMWWCVCPIDDCLARIFGPHRTFDSAHEEAVMNSGCAVGHFAVRGEPDPEAEHAPTVHISASLEPDEYTHGANDWMSWYQQTRYSGPEEVSDTRRAADFAQGAGYAFRL